MRKLIASLFILGGVGVIAWFYATAEKREGGRRGPVSIVAVETAKVKTTDLSDRAYFTGTVRANERYEVAAKINEVIRRIPVDAGDFVQRGDVLAVLEDEESILAVDQAEANLAVAKANSADAVSQLEITRRDYERAERLKEEKVVSAQEYDRYSAAYQAQQAKYEVAVAQVNLAETALRTAQVKLNQTRVVADWSGGSDRRIVARRYLDPGSMAKANDPILAIIDITTVKAVITVNEKEYPKIRVDYPVSIITDAFPNRKFAGKVRRISQELGDLAREADVEIEVENNDLALKPGMFIRAEVEFDHRNDAPAAPLEAVVRREAGDRGVFVVNRESSQVTFWSITEGIHDRGWVELVGGADLLGQEVVVMGQHLLKDGSKVIVSEES